MQTAGQRNVARPPIHVQHAVYIVQHHKAWATRLFPVRQQRQVQPGEITKLILSLHFQQAHGGENGGLG